MKVTCKGDPIRGDRIYNLEGLSESMVLWVVEGLRAKRRELAGDVITMIDCEKQGLSVVAARAVMAGEPLPLSVDAFEGPKYNAAEDIEFLTGAIQDLTGLINMAQEQVDAL